eukprot:CAMPEP_0202894250 /NCGR_PEP_ID=MMETSP1392-20130828/3689_1 /ASSEMBLY_ACC=CAM_ASM_000868 /TAXON_ID=225041 /ORGANISM="Chlamydomonas chlamydogama, Strain SAG 11-48b" /LENGTH=123 /DNA_ID=CAMNT_0049578887 /DNA_START=553 /DNA_END=925 /DNA_ORIENTATION=-
MLQSSPCAPLTFHAAATPVALPAAAAAPAIVTAAVTIAAVPPVSVGAAITLTSGATAAALFPALVPSKQPLPEVFADGFQVHEVAVATSVACVLLVLAACCLPEVSHWRELSYDGAPIIETAL